MSHFMVDVFCIIQLAMLESIKLVFKNFILQDKLYFIRQDSGLRIIADLCMLSCIFYLFVIHVSLFVLLELSILDSGILRKVTLTSLFWVISICLVN